MMRGLFASRGLRFNCEGGAYGTAEQEHIVGAHVEVLRAGGADVATDLFGGVGRDGSTVDGEDFVADLNALGVELGVSRSDNEDVAIDKAGANGKAAEGDGLGRGDVGVTVLEKSIEALEDAVIVCGGGGGCDLRDEGQVGGVPVEVGDVPEVGEAVAGLGPEFGEAGELFGAGEVWGAY